MDGERVEVDDLFGDAAALGDTVALDLPLQPIPVEGLAQYVDDLHRASTEQKRVAWSRLGCVAALSPDGISVNIRHLVFSGAEGKWQLSEEHPIDLSINGDTQHPVLQLEWSQSGDDLALVDSAGRITVVNAFSMALNETTVVRPAVLDREDELSQVLAMYWLNMSNRSYPTFLNALKDQDKWTYKACKRNSVGPFWQKGIVTVTRKGGLNFLYQRHDGRWSTVKAGLRSLTSSGSLFTHAAIVPTREHKLLIAAQSSDRQLLVYLITLDLLDLQQDRQTMADPKISIENVKASVPYGTSKSSDVQNEESMLFDASSHFLSHLEIVPTSTIEKDPQLPPTIMGFYTPVISPTGMAQGGQLGMTTVRRWHVVSAERKLHPNFDSMLPKASTSALGRRADLQRLDDVHINQIITTVQKVDGGELLALGSSDGSLVLYDPSTLTPSYMANDSTELTSIAQTGFVFPPYSRGLNLSISANACIATSLASDGKMHLTHVEYPGGLSYESTDPIVIESTIAVVILSFARSFCSQASSNDTMLFVTRHLDRMHFPRLIQSTFRDLLGDKEFIPAPELVTTPKPIVARVLSLTASLGHDSSTDQRSLASMLSWLCLNIRACTSTLMKLLSSVNQDGGIKLKDPEVCEIACNNIKWTLDLCKFIVDDLFEMADHDLLPPENEACQSASSQTMTQLLLLSILPRSFLKILPRILRGLVRATQDPGMTLSPEAAPTFSRMAELIEASPLKMEPLEQLLSGVDKMIQHFYQVRGMSDRDKAETERFILSHGQIPSVLEDVVPKILQHVFPTIRGKMDRLSLYMEDHSWLGVRDDRKTKAFKRDYVVDVHRKKILRRKGLGKVRKCVRCGSISADLVRMRHWPEYLQNQILRCVCEDVFAVITLEDN